MIYLEDFEARFVKVVKRESRIDADIYYVSYGSDNKRVSALYLIVKDLLGKKELIKGSKDKYLVIDDSNKKVLDVFDKLFKFVGAKIDKINSDDDFFGMKGSNKIIGYDKLKLCTDLELMRAICKMKSLSIKNNDSAYYPPVKLVNLMDFNPEKLGINVVGIDELSIYFSYIW